MAPGDERAPEHSAHTPRSDGAGDLPLVSVGLPVFNADRFLDSCLDSILSQTYPHFELVISDNASTDDTRRICERYAARDARVRFHRVGHNRGLAWNHNHVRDLACGTYFKWCGADDLMGERFLETCVEALRQRPDAVLAYPLSVVIDDAGEPIERTEDRLDLDGPDMIDRFRALLSPWSWTHNPFYGVMRAASLADVRPISPFLANDRCLMAELALRGPFARVEEYLMFRRRHAEHRHRTNETEQSLMAPDYTGRYGAREWTVLRGHLISVARGPVGTLQKLRLLGVVAAWALGNRASLARELVGFAGYLARRLGVRRTRATR